MQEKQNDARLNICNQDVAKKLLALQEKLAAHQEWLTTWISDGRRFVAFSDRLQACIELLVKNSWSVSRYFQSHMLTFYVKLEIGTISTPIGKDLSLLLT